MPTASVCEGLAHLLGGLLADDAGVVVEDQVAENQRIGIVQIEHEAVGTVGGDTGDVRVQRLARAFFTRPLERVDDILRRHLAIALVKLDTLPKLESEGSGIRRYRPAFSQCRLEVLGRHAELAVLGPHQLLVDLLGSPVVSTLRRQVRVAEPRPGCCESDTDCIGRHLGPCRSSSGEAECCGRRAGLQKPLLFSAIS